MASERVVQLGITSTNKFQKKATLSIFLKLTIHRQAVRVLDLGNDGSRTLPTKVGIAQPQRRAFGPSGHHQLSMPSTSSQVLRENTVASKHKRFSLGIERSTNSTSRGAQQVHID